MILDAVAGSIEAAKYRASATLHAVLKHLAPSKAAGNVTDECQRHASRPASGWPCSARERANPAVRCGGFLKRMNAMDMTFPAATSAIPAAPEDRERRPIDRALRAAIGRLSGGLSVTSLSAAYANWFIHLLGSPGKQQQLVEKAWRKQALLTSWATTAARGPCPPCIEPLPQDRRFVGAGVAAAGRTICIYQSFLLQQQWWHNATTGVRGVTAQHENVVDVRGAADARRLVAVELPADQSRGAAARRCRRAA